MIIEVQNEAMTKRVGEQLASLLKGGEVIELIGDVGAGKTTFTKGLAAGLGVSEDVQSPSFTISRVYDLPRGLRLAHYDFYRLQDAGIMSHEINEAMHDPRTITIIEWAQAVDHVLPRDRLQITITASSIDQRRLELIPQGARYETLVEAMV